MKKIYKKLIYLLISILILLGIVYFASGFIIKSLFSEKINEIRIDEIYRINYKSAHINPFTFGVDIKGLELIPDSSQEIQKLYKYHSILAHIQIKKIAIHQIGLIHFLRTKELNLDNIKIKKPIINVYKNSHFKKKKKSEKKEAPDTDVIITQLNDIQINDFSYSYYVKGNLISDFSFESLILEFNHPTINLSKIPDIRESIRFDDISTDMENISIKNTKTHYHINLKDLHYNKQNSKLIIHGFAFIPQLDKKAFAASHTYQSDRMNLNISLIELLNIDIQRFLKDKTICIKKMNVKGANLEVFRDKNYPIDLKKFPKLPQQALRASKQKFEIDSIHIIHANVVYLEKAEETKKVGKIELRNINAKVTNMGNTKAWISKKKMVVNADFSLYDKGHIHTKLTFPLKANTFYYSGHLSKMSLSAFNPFTIPVASLKIKSGETSKLDFQGSANNTFSSGDMDFYYHDLKVSLLKKPKKSGKAQEYKIVNYIANRMLIPNENPDKKGRFYHASIDFERDKNKGFFNYLVKSILSGLKDTLITQENKKNKKTKKE